MILPLLLLAVSASAADTPKPATPAETGRKTLTLALADLYAGNEIYALAKKAYSFSCNSTSSYGQLMVIQDLVERAGALGVNAATRLASKPSLKDPASADLFKTILEEARLASASHGEVKAAAEKCKSFAEKKAHETADPSDGDSPWDTTRMHAGVNVIAIDKIDASAAAKAAEALAPAKK
ncbi:MAG: hypothetical protein M0D55_17230 [Elusimicrobiota bacterium]|nr:MAG: hypothetical protein M0D55_17230 [Elusimicrobiota bacterium]